MDNGANASARIQLGKNGRAVLHADETLALLSGFAVRQFVDEAPAFLSRIHAADRNVLQTWMQAGAEGPLPLRHLRMFHADGHVVCLQVRAVPTASAAGLVVDLFLQDVRTLQTDAAAWGWLACLAGWLRQTSDAVCIANADYVRLAASDSMEALVRQAGFDGTLPGKTLYDVLPRAYADRCHALEQRIHAGELSVRAILPLHRPEGGRIWLELRMYPLHNPAGVLNGVLGIAHDVSDCARNRAELQRNARRLRHLADFNTLLSQVNPAINSGKDEAQVFQDLCALALRDVQLYLGFYAVRPDQPEPVCLGGLPPECGGNMAQSEPVPRLALELIERAWQEETPQFDAPLSSGEDGQRTLAQRAAQAAIPLFRQGQIHAVMLICHRQADFFDRDIRLLLHELALDISRGLDRLDSQRLEHALLNHAQIGVLLVRNRVIEYANPWIERMFGYAPAELVGHDTEAFYLDPRQYLDVGHAYHELLLHGAVHVDNLLFRRHDGTAMHCDGTAVLLSDAQDGRVLWTLQDVTQRETQAVSLRRIARLNGWLADINRMHFTMDDSAMLFDAVCKSALQHQVAAGIWVGRPALEDGVFHVLASVDLTHGAGWLDHHDRPISPLAAQALHERRLVLDASEQLAPVMRHELAALPIVEHERVIAVLVICGDGDEISAADSLELLTAIRTSIERTLVDFWQRARIASLQRLHQALMAMGEVVLTSPDAGHMLQGTCDQLVNQTLFHTAWIGRPGADGIIEVLAHAGDSMGMLHEIRVTIMNSECIFPVVRAWNEQHVELRNDLLGDLQHAPWHGFYAKHRWHALLAVPIVRSGAIWAVLVFVSSRRNVFDAQTIELCGRVTGLLGHGLDELDLKQRLSDMQRDELYRAEHDPLTDLPNRRQLNQYLPAAMSRARRNGYSLAVGLIDLDDFKPVNDSWGHEAGDRLLKILSTRMRDQLRETDFLARLGGDEFIIVIEGLDEFEAASQLEVALRRLHQAVEQAFEIAPGQSAWVGMTMGLALFPRDADDADALIRLADAAMYQAKQIKENRTQWWRLGVGPLETMRSEPEIDSYGAEATVLLERMQGHIAAVVEHFVHTFYGELAQSTNPQEILATLTDEELHMLMQRQAEHLRFLLAPQTTREAIISRARRVGEVHALSGVSGALLIRSQTLYHRTLNRHLNRMPMRSSDRYRLMVIAESRLQDDVQVELEAGGKVMRTWFDILSQPIPPHGTLWMDAVSSEIGRLGTLPGLRGALLLRLNTEGVFTVERHAGPVADGIVAIIQQPGHEVVVDPTSERGQSLTAQAWRSLKILSTPSRTKDPNYRFWRDSSPDLGVRSAMSLPILNGEGQVQAVVALYGAMSNQFESAEMHQWARGLQQRWEQLWVRCSTPAPVISQERAILLRHTLFAGGLRMYMQPIIDLHSGQVVKVEALARLVQPDGEVVTPAMFLPLLGDSDLDRLFRAGLDLTLGQLVQWEAQGLSVDVSVNLSPNSLLDPDCSTWVREALQRYGVAPQRLTLELLETQELDYTRQDAAINELVGLGVKLAMDDLGSGYSSLKRLAALPFDTIKIDQDLLVRIRENPLQTLGLIGAIIQMGRDFGRKVVVEGIDDAGVIEAMLTLGADYGQGYGLGKPMPGDQLVSWNGLFHRTWQPAAELRTFLGALSWRWLSGHSGVCAHPVQYGDCQLTAFLQQHAGAGSDPALWHEQVHADPGAGQASQQLFDWLVQQVKVRM